MTYEKMVSDIREQKDYEQAFKDATLLAESMRDMSDQAATLRGEIVYKMITERRMTLAKIAALLNISKSRASQLKTTGKAATETAPTQ